MRVFDEIKRFYAEGNNMVRKLVVVNVLVFLAASLVALILWSVYGKPLGLDGYFKTFIKFFAVPADPAAFILRPWSLVTYSFMHIEFVHILFNMIILYWLGSIFKEYLGNGKTLSTYIFGSISGALLYIAAYNFLPALSTTEISNIQLIGASAGVVAIVVALGTFLPYYEVGFFNIYIPMRWIAVLVFFLSLISIPYGNAGGQIAHLGGAIYGFFYARQLRRNSSWGSSGSSFMGSLFKKKPNVSVVKKDSASYSSSTVADFEDEYEPNQDEIDAILDKINQSGYESLTRKERELLYKASRQH